MEEFATLPDWAKGQKETKMSSASVLDPGDIEPRVAWYRNNEEVALGFADRVDRDRGLQMAMIGIRGFKADRVDMIFDTHVTDERFYERYGRNPDPLELQGLCDNEGACEIGLTTDAIFCTVMWRDSDRVVSVSVPYHVDKRRAEVEFVTDAKARKARRHNRMLVREGGRWFQLERTVHWMDDRIQWMDSLDKGNEVSGRIVDVIQAAFEQPSPDMIDQTMADHAVAAILTQAGFLVAVPSRSEEEDALLAERIAAVTQGETGALTLALRERLLREARASHDADEAERARRQQLRVDGRPTEEDASRLIKPRRP